MAYNKTNWLDRAVQFATRYLKTGETSSGVTLTADPGTITQAGTPVNASNLNKLEQGVYDAHVTADAALPRAGGIMTGQLVGKSNTGKIQDKSDFLSSSFQVTSNGGVNDSAFISFHRPGMYAAHFGLDYDNKWKVGGYSMGTVAYELWTDQRLRTTNGYVEWNNGGMWQPMGDIQVGRLREATANAATANTYVTVVNVAGMGRLELATAYIQGGYTGTVRVTIDGVAESMTFTNGGSEYRSFSYLGPKFKSDSTSPDQYTQTQTPISFYSSLKVEFSTTFTFGIGTVSYRMKLGTP